MTGHPYDPGHAPPRGASAQARGDALTVTWPSMNDGPSFGWALNGWFIGVFVSIPVMVALQGYPWLFVVGGVVGVVGGWALGRAAPRSFVHLTISPSEVSVTTSGALFSGTRRVDHATLRGVVMVEDERGGHRSGAPLTVLRLVAVPLDDERVVLVESLASAEYGRWAEACYDAWTKQHPPASR